MSNATILVVEDEAITGMDLKESLSGLGYTVCGVVPTGELAVVRAGECRPDLVLMDIALAGQINGIEAAAQIRERFGTPVIFLTAHFEDSTIAEAAATNPVGYLVKPIDEKTLKVTIQMALLRKEQGKAVPAESEALPPEKNMVFLKKACSGVTLLLYSEDVNKLYIFENFIADSIASQVPCIYAYYRTKLVSRFRKSIKKGDISVFELRKSTDTINRYLDELTKAAETSGTAGKLLGIIDFSNTEKFEDLVRIKSKLVEAGNLAWESFLVIIAVPMESLTAPMLEEVSAGVNQLVVLSGEDNIITFSTPLIQNETVNAVPQKIFEAVVKKSLEYVILSCLDRPVTGFEIIHEIKARFHTDIPIARVYSYLYELENDGVLSTEVIGRKRVYSPTPEGEKYIANHLQGIAVAYRQVLGPRHGTG